ncbi:GntR family transcriptional regulator [Pseudomonas sp. 37 R 15]|uniref:GntR family transcriptional regulator n=1 Tax=Pseudomonas sp. 37 R 15 TaxID=1844104 RepID=UPI00081C2211|nr:GntR family transcriptional regulator [Pseudomonas sp. 37 R 15]
MTTILTPDVLKTLPLVDQAYNALRKALIDCEFEPGDRLRVEELQRKFGFSSSPLREALNRLVRGGLINIVENRGFRVAPITVAAVKDLTRVRLLVEVEAMRDSITHGDDEWESRLVAAFHKLSIIEQRMGPEPGLVDSTWVNRHRAFHLSTYSACTSPLLLEMVEGLFDQAERFRIFSARNRNVNRAKSSEHENLYNAVLSRDGSKATELLTNHIRSTEKFCCEKLVF